MAESTLLEWANRIAQSAVEADEIELGPFAGSMRSRTADQVPREYVASGTDFLYQPRERHFKRRGGQTQKFDTFGASVGLLPAKWSAKGRWMESFTSESITDGIQTTATLATKETIASGLDDGRFSQLYIRDQINNLNYTLGDEFGDVTYPEPGAAQAYKVVPLWYESGDGGITRGAFEFARRFFFSGSRRFHKVGNWWYFPSLRGTPSRWRGRFTPSAMVSSFAGHQYGRPTSISGGTGNWTNQAGSAVNIWNVIDEVTRDDADYITEGIIDGAGSTLLTVQLWGAGGPGFTPAASATATFRITAKRIVVSGSPAGTEQFRFTLKSGSTTVKQVDTTVTNTVSFDLIEVTLSAAEFALINFTNSFVVEISTIGQGNLHLFHDVSWMELDFAAADATLQDNANRLIPSGPLPPLHSGTLSKGTVISDSGAIYMRPDADITDGGWTNQAGSATNIYQSIDESTLDTADYIKAAAGSAAAEIRLSDPGYTPTLFDNVHIHVTWRATSLAVGEGVQLNVRLLQGATQKAQFISILLAAGGGSSPWTSVGYTLTGAELAAITDWNDLRVEFTAITLPTGEGDEEAQIALSWVAINQTVVQTQGGWKGSDRFYYSVAFRFEDGSVWMPCEARPPSQLLLNGYNIFTVDLANPNTTYDRVIWSNIPIGPHGCVGRVLLRTPKISAVKDDNLQINPFDLRIVWEITDNTTTTYDDYYGTDDSLTLDVAKAFIRFDHIMPPRARYIFGGDMRVCHSYGGQNPCAIQIAPVGRTADYDLNVDDTNAAAYNEDGSYMLLAIDSSGAGTLTLIQSDGTSVTNTKSFVFTTYDTLQKLVDAINATNCADDGQQWRAQVCPGANPNARTLDLTPHSRAIASCVVSGQTITKSAGGLAKVAVGTRISGTGVTIGAYVTRIDSDTQLTFSGTITAGTKTLTFYTELGDSPTAATADSGYQRVICGALPGFLFFTEDYLDNHPLEKQTVWMTVASPGQAKSAANNFSGKRSNSFSPPASAGISMGGAPVDQGFVTPYSHAIYVIKNVVNSGSGIDEEYRQEVINEARGCCAWNTVVPGNRFVPYLTPHGLFAADLEREIALSDDVFVHAPDARGDFTYEVPLCVAATDADNDSAYASARIMRSAIWLSFRASGAHPNRQTCYDFSAGLDQSGLDALIRGAGDPWPGRPWGWSVPLVRAVTAMVESSRGDGTHLYGWNDENAGSVGDGRIDEIETGDTDNGTAIDGNVESGWIKPSPNNQFSVQEIILEHNAPVGSTGSLVFTRSFEGDAYTLTPGTSSTLDVKRERKFVPQAASVGAAAFKVKYRQLTGGARTVRKMTPKVKEMAWYG